MMRGRRSSAAEVTLACADWPAHKGNLSASGQTEDLLSCLSAAHYIPPRLTRAALGHSTHRNAVSSAGSGEHQAPVRRPALENFKLSKFTDPRKIHAKVDTSTPPAIKTIRPIRDLRQTQTSVKAQ